MENVEINITPMSLKNGVMGLPIQCCRNWDASVLTVFFSMRDVNLL